MKPVRKSGRKDASAAQPCASPECKQLNAQTKQASTLLLHLRVGLGVLQSELLYEEVWTPQRVQQDPTMRF